MATDPTARSGPGAAGHVGPEEGASKGAPGASPCRPPPGRRGGEDGFALVLVLVVVVLVAAVAVEFNYAMRVEIRLSANLRARQQALYIARAGLERTTRALIELESLEAVERALAR